MKRKQVYYEPSILQYDLGKQLFEKFKKENAQFYEIESHNNIEELRKKENKKVSDFLVPYTSSGCSAMCLYCYLVCNYNKCSYFRYFVNREYMMEKLIKHTKKYDKQFCYEIGSNSDLILENIVTNNLDYTINEFAKNERGYLTFPTKFGKVENILNYEHKGRIIIRMSVNPQYIIETYELKTSNLKYRVEAINMLVDAGYKVGVLIAPVIMIENYKQLYSQLVEYLYENLNEKAKQKIFFEVIFMTYSYIHRKINEEAFPHIDDLYDKNLMKGRGYGKYCYKDEQREGGKVFINGLLQTYFPKNEIIYMV